MLSLKNITKRFGAVEVLRDVSIDFAPGTVTALVGDNGAGKSTLLKVITGVVSPDSGSLTLNQSDITLLDPSARRERGIEMVYQDLALAPEHDVTTNLFIGREIISALGFVRRRVMRKKAAEALSRIEINIASLDQPVGRLSGGQQQAIAIARSLLFHPSVLLLDEPTAALAVREVDRVLDLIRREKEAGRVVILVSHRLNDVFAVADRIVVLKHGTIASDDPTSNVTLREVVERIVS